MIRTGQVLVKPDKDPASAFRREIQLLLTAGQQKEAFGLCIGLALITAKPIEELWDAELAAQELI